MLCSITFVLVWLLRIINRWARIKGLIGKQELEARTGNAQRPTLFLSLTGLLLFAHPMDGTFAICCAWSSICARSDFCHACSWWRLFER
jgi:hypothetical protein